MWQCVFATAMAVLALAGAPQQRGAVSSPAPAGPSVTYDTPKGAFVIQFFPVDAPKSVEHLLALVKRNFYRGQRIHRVEASLVQFGDPTSRDMSRRDWWGRAGSGDPIGVAEFSKRTHVRGVVALANTGNAKGADSQIYICKTAMPSLDGKYVIVGQVIKGMEVVDRLQVTDVLRNVTLTAAAR
ncbi:MAG: peptidylprolyl isomerase [Acidobacteriota bacterium]